MRISNFQFPIADCEKEYTLYSPPIGNWQSAIGNSFPHDGSRGLKPAALTRAFSLVEMMIAIVILGLGLVMVATMFPVAWDRARTLSEYTVEQSAAAGAQSTLESLLRPAGHSLAPRKDPLAKPPYEELHLTAGSLAGDMFFDPTLAHPQTPTDPVPPRQEWYKAILAFSDTSVHALNVENLPFIGPAGPTPVGEDPWDLEDPVGSFPTPLTQIVQQRFLFPESQNYPDVGYPRNRGEAFPDRLFFTPQVRVWQRLYPPMEAPPPADDPDIEKKLDQWNEKLATRRFCWAVLHRLRSRVGPAPLPSDQTPSLPQSDEMVRQASAAMGTTRTFDMYYVTLRRSKSTNRYARQDPDDPMRIPNPFTLTTVPVEPIAKAAVNDVMFPVAWRVQMMFPPLLPLAADATRIPTEIHVPPTGITPETARMLVQMFPAGAQFVDEITGNIYRVAKRRIVDNNGESAMLTLDREVVMQDFDMPPGDPRCGIVDLCQPGMLVAQELLRTVWVFPPPVDSADRLQFPDKPTPLFDGPSPVVDIEVGSLSISPSS